MFSQWFFGAVSFQINNSVDTRFEFGKIACIRYADMRAHELKTVRHVLATAVGITASSLARQARGARGVSEHMANLVRLIEGGVDVEAFAHKSRGRRDSPAKSTKSSNAADPKSEGWKRARKDSV